MSPDIRDWLGFAFTTASLLISLYGLSGKDCRWHRRRERFRSFKGFGIEWIADDRDDDAKS
jgi:hypothetical protein